MSCTASNRRMVARLWQTRRRPATWPRRRRRRRARISSPLIVSACKRWRHSPSWRTSFAPSSSRSWRPSKSVVCVAKERNVCVSDFLSSRRSKVVQSVRDARARIEIRDDAMRDIREAGFKPRAIILQSARIFLRLPRLRASRGAIPASARGPPHRSGALFFFRSSDDVAFKADTTKRIFIIIPRPLLSLPERHRPTQKRRWHNNDISTRRKRIRHRALCDRTRPKRDRNETYRVCERKHGTCFSSVFVRRRVRACESFRYIQRAFWTMDPEI